MYLSELLWWFMKKLTFVSLTFFLIVFTVLSCSNQAEKDLRVHFIDVGQGDAILIQSPGGENILIDGGERQAGIMRYLKKNKVKKLDVLVATHPHSDHIGGLIEVLQETRVKKVLANGQIHTTKTYEEFLEAIDKSGAEFHEARRGDEIIVGNMTFKVLHPIQPFFEDMNNNSIALQLLYNKVSFLFTGDIDEEAEQSIISSANNLESTILNISHHASKKANSQAFLAAVSPEVAIYTAGKDNPYGHPHRETIFKLKSMNIRIYGTDINGTIIISTDGVSYTVKTGKDAE